MWKDTGRQDRRSLNRLVALTVLLAVPAIAPTFALAEEGVGATARPNVVLVMTDDQGYGDLGCHGNQIVKTPTLDRLYAESIRLTNFHVDPTCSPTRAALLTGRYSCRTGVWHTIMGRSLLRRDEVTAADVLSAAGYLTGIFGKWHLGDNYPFRAMDRGFQESLVHGDGALGTTPDHWGNTYFSPVLVHNGRLLRTEGYCTDVLFTWAITFIEANRQRPFFVYIPTNVPHSPYQVADKYSKPYLAKGVPATQAAFYGMITNFDENLGRLLGTLEQLGLEENTIVIFMTDNGTSGAGFNQQMRGRKGSEYDGGHRVPCFIRWPAQLEGGRDIDRLTAHIDVLPTLLDLCNVPRPRGLQFDGMSLRPLLRTRGEAWPRRTLFVQSHRIEAPEPWRKSAVMTDRFRLVNGEELYDVRQDPGQTTNIAEGNRGVVTILRQSYKEWYADVSGRFDEYCEIVLGSPNANPTTLTCHDWHGPTVPWNQSHVAQQIEANGFWAVELEQSGQYEITLRQRPAWVNHPLQPGNARLKIGKLDVFLPVRAGTNGVTFSVNLEAGKTQIETWLLDRAGGMRGAYFVDVRYLGPAGAQAREQ